MYYTIARLKAAEVTTKHRAIWTPFGDLKAFNATVDGAFVGCTMDENFRSRIGIAYNKCIGPF